MIVLILRANLALSTQTKDQNIKPVLITETSSGDGLETAR